MHTGRTLSIYWIMMIIIYESRSSRFTWKQQSRTGAEWTYCIRCIFSLTSYSRTEQSQEETSTNCVELGANRTAEMPSSGALFNLISLMIALIELVYEKKAYDIIRICTWITNNTQNCKITISLKLYIRLNMITNIIIF